MGAFFEPSPSLHSKLVASWQPRFGFFRNRYMQNPSKVLAPSSLETRLWFLHRSTAWSSKVSSLHGSSRKKLTAMEDIVAQLRSDEVLIDAVGMKSYVVVGKVPATLVEGFLAYEELPELDIPMELPVIEEPYEQ
ncbi:glycoside hydrolase family 10 protein [Daedalea quercina L-15889]|uniref:Glycoside hydrolase family 10 protein n=1 Tax=Daedalea quercina L-15889 TaxID=1314783 RepID=A0A165PK24_9APHY|nr:glycoside hydrolase family 10 protein [Daedalea quercina L-15889]